MPASTRPPGIPIRTFYVRQRPDQSRWELVDENGELYGVDRDKHQAISSARREATLASRADARALVMVEQPNGKWKQEFCSKPPKVRKLG